MDGLWGRISGASNDRERGGYDGDSFLAKIDF